MDTSRFFIKVNRFNIQNFTVTIIKIYEILNYFVTFKGSW